MDSGLNGYGMSSFIKRDQYPTQPGFSANQVADVFQNVSLNQFKIAIMVKSLNGTYFQYWTKVMLDIQKANALGDSPDFPIIKVSVFNFLLDY